MTGGSPSGFHFIQEWLDCQRRFYWRFVERLEPKGISRNLVFGVAIHEALAEWTRKGRDLAAAIKKFSDVYLLEVPRIQEVDQIEEDIANGPLLLMHYATHYAGDAYRVLAVEEEIHGSLGKDTFTGRVDLVVENQGRVEIRDYKTTRANFPMIERSLRITDQSNGYMWLWNKQHPEQASFTIVYDLMKLYRGKAEFLRIPVTRAESDVERFAVKARHVLNEIATRVSTPNAVYVENTGNCYAWNRACPYYDLCWASASQAVKDSLYTKREEVALDGDNI